MTDLLREELARIADRAPLLPVADDTWARARRARHRGRVVAAVAALSLVAVLGGLAALVVAGPEPVLPADPPASDGGSVPSTLFPVPDHLQGVSSDGRFTGPLSPTLAVGRGSVAFVTGNGLPVVVDAADGGYHLLDLPGWPLGDVMVSTWLDPASSQPLALSPDGRSLAYGWAEPGGRTATASVPAGLRVVDLASGDVRTVTLSGPRLDTPGQALQVRTLAWSPDSRWLVWSGQHLAQWNAGGMSGHGEPAAGRVAPGATTSEPLPASGESSLAWSIDEGGEVVRAGQGGRVRLLGRADGFRLDVDEVLNVTPAAMTAPDRRHVVLGDVTVRREVTFLDLREGSLMTRALSPQVYPQGARVRPLGWLDGDTVVVLAQTEETADDTTGLDAPHVALMSAPWVPEGQWTYRIVTRSEPGDWYGAASSYHSVAVDLLAPDRPTRDLPRPDWPWSTDRKVVVGGLAVLGLVLAAYLLVRARRRRLP
jgi:hypothetical protein